MKKLLYLLAVSSCLLAISCARMGNPDGGWFDDTPPRVVSASPNDKGVQIIVYSDYTTQTVIAD